jgi:hypothetical protein
MALYGFLFSFFLRWDIDIDVDVEVEGKVKLGTIDWMAGLKCNKINPETPETRERAGDDDVKILAQMCSNSWRIVF